MSESLGEKLRQAREDKGLTLGDVAEQTRISSLYLDAIENDDYKILPGGIFNKGFIKSYAKFVGINEQEALMDYQAVLARSEMAVESGQRVYKPETLTDYRSGSMLPTMILAGLVLVVMTVGILYLVSYLRAPSSTVALNTARPPANAGEPTTIKPEPNAGAIPDMATIKVELKATTQPVKVITAIDGAAPAPINIAAGSSADFEPKHSLTINYLRWNSSVIQLLINGKQIALPSAPLKPEDKDRIVFTIAADTLPQIWTSGSVGSAPVADASPVAAPTVTPKPSPKVVANTNAAPANVAVPKPMVQSKPTPKPTIITVGTPKPPHE
ncbi:MAG TPA: helix-turn-helix domain-containing protein [Pyrinomonadaceae bacterium]|jgi:cytoskeletal protein RodZ